MRLPINQAAFLVRLLYLDFFSREPDSCGLNFWTNEITSCDSNQQCIEVKRINVSAAFYLSIEFQQTGYLMQYFGYLRRNPDDPQDTDYTGYDFWLTKLNQFNGNFQNAEMVKAFISSDEYRRRSGP